MKAMEKWFRHAAQLNTAGASLCNNGNEKKALEYFRSSLQIISSLARGCDNPKNMPWVHEFTGEAFQAKRLVSTSDADDEKLHFLYRHALAFANNTIIVDSVHLCFYLAVIEFNMALTLHLQSKITGERSLLNALHIYDYCLEHIHHSGCCLRCHKVLLAALNNKAAILYELSAFQESRDVLEALMAAIDYCKNDGTLSSICDEDLEGVLFNVMLLRRASLAPAA